MTFQCFGTVMHQGAPYWFLVEIARTVVEEAIDRLLQKITVIYTLIVKVGRGDSRIKSSLCLKRRPEPREACSFVWMVSVG